MTSIRIDKAEYRSERVGLQCAVKMEDWIISNPTVLVPCSFRFLGPPHDAVEKQPKMGSFG